MEGFEPVAEDEGGADILELQDVIANDHEDPATIAARKIDWDNEVELDTGGDMAMSFNLEFIYRIGLQLSWQRFTGSQQNPHLAAPWPNRN